MPGSEAGDEEKLRTAAAVKPNLGKQPVDREMAAWDNVEGFEFQHDLIMPSFD